MKLVLAPFLFSRSKTNWSINSCSILSFVCILIIVVRRRTKPADVCIVSAITTTATTATSFI